MKKIIFCCLILICNYSYSQDVLPKFYTRVLGNSKVQISWTNPFGDSCIQLSIQRSYDSLKFYNTIFTSLSPELPQNGYVDNDYLPQLKNYYRIFYVLSNGKYFFSTPINPKNFTKVNTETVAIKTDDSTINATTFTYNENDTAHINLITIQTNTTALPVKKIFTVYKRKTTHLAYVFDEPKFQLFSDSIAQKTKDTLLVMDNEIVIWNPYTPPPSWKPSTYIFTNAKGNVDLFFDNYKNNKYKVIIFDVNGKELFRIKQITQPKLTLEKANFLKSGWYFFELYENEKLIEKNKFMLEADF